MLLQVQAYFLSVFDTKEGKLNNMFTSFYDWVWNLVCRANRRVFHNKVLRKKKDSNSLKGK